MEGQIVSDGAAAKRTTSHYALGPGFCCICGQPVYRFGWHVDLWGCGANRNAVWHAACVAAWDLWTAPSDHTRVLKRLQPRRCAETGRRLWKTAEVDHRVPLFRVWREHRHTPWPSLLGFWGVPNLQVINRDVHLGKCAKEARSRCMTAAGRRRKRPRGHRPGSAPWFRHR